MNIFSPDSLFMRIMSRIGDLLILNVLFLLCSLPIVTIGASWTALCSVCFRFDTQREGKLLVTFFHSFRENFKQSTLLWMILLTVGAITAANAWIFYLLPGPLHYGFILFGAILVLVLITASLVFPLISQFSNDWRTTLKNGLLLGIGYLPRSLVLAALNTLPFACLFLNFYLFLQISFMWVALYFASAAYASTFLLRKVFAPYLTEEKEQLL